MKSFSDLLSEVKADVSRIDSLSEEEVSKLREHLNPYSKTIGSGSAYTCMSAINMSERYMRRFTMTSLVGYLYRQVDEYKLADSEPTCPLDDYKFFMKSYQTAASDAVESIEWMRANPDAVTTSVEYNLHKHRITRAEGFQERLIVRKFIDNLFQFNPDKHVRSAFAENPLDPERVVPAQVCESTDADKPRATSHFVNHIPPVDTFHRWEYYTESNYEEIRSAVTDIYHEKPDLEYAINPFGQFETSEAAAAFVQKHKDDVITDVVTLTNGHWNLMGSFKNNRERVDFYNGNTGVLEALFKQVDADKKLGAELMQKRVMRKKKINIQEAGPDPADIKQFRRDNPSGFEMLGASDVTKDTTVGDPNRFKVHEDCPYDAVQVDVINIANGGTSLTRSEFFTQAEAPQKLE